MANSNIYKEIYVLSFVGYIEAIDSILADDVFI